MFVLKRNNTVISRTQLRLEEWHSNLSHNNTQTCWESLSMVEYAMCQVKMGGGGGILSKKKFTFEDVKVPRKDNI